MNVREYRNIQEAYLDIYQEVDEATAMAKRGLNEPAIRQQIASKTGGGSFADKAGKLADTQTYGQKGKGAPDPAARENLARKQRGDFRKTTSSSPGLRGYGHKATTDADKAKQSARGAQRGALTPNEKKQLGRESYDLHDVILSHLINEGYADTVEAAESILVNMSEDWRESIVEESKKKPMVKVQVDPKKLGYRVADIGPDGKEHNVKTYGAMKEKLDYAKLAKMRRDALDTPAAKKAWDNSPSNPESPNYDPKKVMHPETKK